jgi:hypothetical protein
VDCAGHYINVQQVCSRGGKCATPPNEMVCSKKCGGGVSKNKWRTTRIRSGNGEPCDLRDGEVVTTECNTHPCAVPCQGGWDLASDAECTKPCGGGTIPMTYAVRREAAHGGKECEAADSDAKPFPCNEQKCVVRCDEPGKPCVVPCEGKFSEWSACDARCGQEAYTRPLTHFI